MSLVSSNALAEPQKVTLQIGEIKFAVPLLPGVYFEMEDGVAISTVKTSNNREEKKLHEAFLKHGNVLPVRELILNFRHLCDNTGFGPCLTDGKYEIPLDTMNIRKVDDRIFGGKKIYKISDISLSEFGIEQSEMMELVGRGTRCRGLDCNYFVVLGKQTRISFDGFVGPMSPSDGSEVKQRALHYLRMFLEKQGK